MQDTTDQRWSNLNPQQRDGVACLWCNSTALPMQPVGYSATTGSLVFACTDECAGMAAGAVVIAEALGETAPIDVQRARRFVQLVDIIDRLREIRAAIDAMDADS